MTLRVLYLTGHPAEGQLSAPIIRRLKADPYFEIKVWKALYPPIDPYGVFAKHLFNADIVCSPCDRKEILAPTIDAFFANKIIVRIYAGINTSGGTHDDVVRRMLDSMGHLLLVESEECRQSLIRQGEEEWRIPAPFGLTHLDDVELDYASCPAEPYAVLLMNPVTISREQTIRDAGEAMNQAEYFVSMKSGYVVILPPNGDKYSDAVLSVIRSRTRFLGTKALVYDERFWNRNRFLGLLAKCDLYISNSSSTWYEAPALGLKPEQIYNPSWRNQERPKPPPLQAGGSDRIVKVLKSIQWQDKSALLRKQFRY